MFFKNTPVEHLAPELFVRYCRDRSIRIYCTDTEQGLLYTEADLRSPCAILLGNEGSGSIDEVFSDLPALRIPMADGIESLNVALAGAVILFEAARQRRLI
ncbi:MAG: TrmH family RNA methyltransferase [Acidobacteriota bacterium]